MRAKHKVCRCNAYAFPHREFSGKCEGDEEGLCTCTAPPARPTDISPPEVQRNKHCPVHGIDWDALREQRLDREFA